MPSPSNGRLDVERAVLNRYSAAARQSEAELCVPVEYGQDLLAAIPREVLERDYGCGNPTAYLAPGETVLDLGSGSGKHCFMAAQVVGVTGHVIGVDLNDAMLALARKHAPDVARRLGFANVEFRKGRIQDLATNLDRLDAHLAAHPVRSTADLAALDLERERLSREDPLVASDSIDVVVSNCVLNLVEPAAKRRLFDEIFRVLKKGGRAVISDIVSDEDVPEAMQADADLWSGCISGALREDAFLTAFEDAGFHGIELLERRRDPWRTVQGIEFRSVTAVAYKGKQGPCWDHKQGVVYKGPFHEVDDDDGHTYRRGVRTAVCKKTFELLGTAPYAGHFIPIEPLTPVDTTSAAPFPCTKASLVRHPRETKGEDYRLTTEAADCCEPEKASCCP